MVLFSSSRLPAVSFANMRNLKSGLEVWMYHMPKMYWKAAEMSRTMAPLGSTVNRKPMTTE